MKVLVTGGAGFIGSHTVDLLVKRGHDVFIVDNLSNGNMNNVNKKAKFFKADIKSSKLNGVFQEVIPDCVIHLAAHINLRDSLEDPFHDANENIMGSLNVLECCRHFNVKKIVYSSTAAVYGEPRYLPIDEAHLIRPSSPYGLSKSVVEDYIRLYNKLFGMDYVILRYANVYGPRQDPNGEAGVISIFIDKMLHNKKPEIFGDGMQTRDFIFVEDVAAANLASINGKSGIYNVSTCKETSINEILENVIKLSGFKGRVMKKDAKKEVKKIFLKCEKITESLGWKPKTGIEEGLEKTFKYFSENKQTK